MGAHEIEQAIKEAEQALYRAMIAQEFPALDRILAEDLTYVHSTGVAESKAGYLAGVRDGLYDYERITSRWASLRTHGDAAIVDGIVEMLVGARGKPRDVLRLLFVLIWKMQGGTWRLEYRQATRIP